ncbi:MAG TPA: MlaD family protein [Solirubrobacteraceae bacterium]|jgi:phospholipid/cholesterol/gamma-HCH transport system substrate-binding protein|nr:MlaD family protein [Solirubrobacteraceae bacterium]
MQKRAPTLANILVIVLFALSCFGLLLFLWDSFGGPVPLKPKGYRFTVQLSRTLALAEQSDVRIAGVDVGHVVSLATHPNETTDVTVEMDHQYAPIYANYRMILRQKTLLGETFIELFPPGTPGGGGTAGRRVADGGRLAASQVDPAVTLDDILSALTPKVRGGFQQWQQTLAAASSGRGEQINADIAELEPFVENANKLVTILASQEGAVRAVVHNTGVLFDALTERDNQFRGFIVNGERAFHAFAASSTQWANAFRELPAFEHGATSTLREFDSLATVASPVLKESYAWERELTPLLEGVKEFTPDFNKLLTDYGPFTSASKKGLPAFEKVLGDLTPLLGNVTPVLRNFQPFLKFTGEYVPELQALFANAAAATNAHDKNADISTGQIQHYLRALNTVNPEGLAVYPARVGTNRANPYFQPGAFNLLGKGGLQVFSTAACADLAPSVNPETANATVSKSIIEQLIEDHVVNGPNSTANQVGAPACTQQPPFSWEGVTSQYPRVTSAK